MIWLLYLCIYRYELIIHTPFNLISFKSIGIYHQKRAPHGVEHTFKGLRTLPKGFIFSSNYRM